MSSNIIAIDIGIKHFAKAYVRDGKLIDFSLDELQGTTVIDRINSLKTLLKDITPETHLVIERQVRKNVVAMSLMYAVVMYASTITSHISIVSPTDKFWKSCLMCPKNYYTRKKMAINYVKENYIPENLIEKFDYYKKKDDISDAIWMACVA